MNITDKAGLYIHIPFCRSKCGYCDFYSVTESQHISSFVTALHDEIALLASQINTREIFDTLYFGGGTPSILSAGQIQTTVELLRKYFNISDDCETTLEANPGTLTLKALQDLKSAGINRLSVGVQSFDQKELRILERNHSVADAETSVSDARTAGFDNISIDLIFALPGQKNGTWRKNLEKAVTLNPDHMSVYNLTFVPGTPFYRRFEQGNLQPAPEKREREMFEDTREFLKKSGYYGYEVSSYARSAGFISRHNYKYWTHTPYLGFGPSAHSFWRGERWANSRSLMDYLHKIGQRDLPRAFTENLNSTDLEMESILLALRTYRGLNMTGYRKRFGHNFASRYGGRIGPLLQGGLAKIEADHFFLTEKGMLICDEIIPRITV